MDESRSPPESLSFEARVAARLAVGFMLDIAAIGRIEGRMLDALLVAAVIEANTSPILRDPALQLAYARADAPPPDALRRPVSISALAGSLNLPFETVRRHAKRLVAEGLCRVAPQGLYVPAQVLDTPQFIAAAKARYERSFRFCAELHAAGVVGPLPYAPPPADAPEAPVRAVGRILSDFFFRSLETMNRDEPDPLTTMIFLQVARMSREHQPPVRLDRTPGAEWTGADVRASVPVAQVAKRMGTPYETTRRHIGKLVEQGVCRRTAAGVVPDEGYATRPAVIASASENLVNVRRMWRRLAALGSGASLNDVPRDGGAGSREP